MDFICNNTCRVWQKRKDDWGKARGGVPARAVSLARAVRGDGQCRVAQGSPWHPCASGTGVEQSRRDALCWQKVPILCPLQAGSSLPEPGSFGKLGLLPAGLGCSDCKRL